MLSWLSSLFMNSTADFAWESAIYSAGLASSNGMHQMEEPENLQKIAADYKASRA